MTALVAPLTRKTVASAAQVLLVVAPLVVLHPLPAAGQAGRRPAETQEVVLTVEEVRDFPIASLHPRAFKAHEAGHCAGEQGKYWEMHDRLFAEQKVAAASELRLHGSTDHQDGEGHQGSAGV